MTNIHLDRLSAAAGELHITRDECWRLLWKVALGLDSGFWTYEVNLLIRNGLATRQNFGRVQLTEEGKKYL